MISPELREVIEACVLRLREEEPSTVAVLLAGSYARGQSGSFSDVDLQALTREEPNVHYRAWFCELPGGRIVHISAGAMQWEDWFAQEKKSERWAWFFPGREPLKLLWADESVEERLRQPDLVHPPGPVELEDFLERAGKVRNAMLAGDELILRLAAQELARYCPSVLRPINPERVVNDPNEAFYATLELPVAPPNYREDLLICLGMDGRARTAGEVHDAAMRLVVGMLELLSRHVEELRPVLEPELPRYLADGTLLRYITQGVD